MIFSNNILIILITFFLISCNKKPLINNNLIVTTENISFKIDSANNGNLSFYEENERFENFNGHINQLDSNRFLLISNKRIRIYNCTMLMSSFEPNLMMSMNKDILNNQISDSIIINYLYRDTIIYRKIQEDYLRLDSVCNFKSPFCKYGSTDIMVTLFIIENKELVPIRLITDYYNCGISIQYYNTIDSLCINISNDSLKVRDINITETGNSWVSRYPDKQNIE